LAHLGPMVLEQQSVEGLSAEQLRELASRLLTDVRHKQAVIDKLTHENALLKRLKFAAQSERYSAEQRSLLDETLDTDLQAVSDEIAQNATPAAVAPAKQQPKRQPLPAQPAAPRDPPRARIHHLRLWMPDEAHRRGRSRETGLRAGRVHGRAPHSRQVGLHKLRNTGASPGAGTRHRQRHPHHRAAGPGADRQVRRSPAAVPAGGDLCPGGSAIARSTLAQWVGSCGVQLQPLVDALKNDMLRHSVLHADETPVQMLKPGNGKTHRAYLWAYAPGAFEDLKAVVYDFCETRAGENARAFLGEWKGSLVCDDFAGYKAGFAHGVTEAGCLAHARRKFFDLHASSKSQVAESALQQIGMVYEIEREVQEPDA
jgi:transposase